MKTPRTKQTLLLLALPVLAFPLAAQFATASGQGDERALVERAVLDYVEGIYDVKPEYIERSVSPELVKLGFYREGAGEWRENLKMTYAELHELAARYNAEGRVPADAPKQVEVLDVLDKTAAAKLTAHWGIDYMHLAKQGGKWQIVQVLWQSHPQEKAAAR